METFITKLKVILKLETELFISSLTYKTPCHLFATSWAKETFWVPCLVQSWDTLVQYRTPAISTPWGEEKVVVFLTVWLAISLEEVHCAQFLIAVAAGKVLRVPSMTKCSDNLTHYWFATCCTHTLLFGLDSLLIHVFLQVAQHVIKIRSTTNHLLFKQSIKISIQQSDARHLLAHQHFCQHPF